MEHLVIVMECAMFQAVCSLVRKRDMSATGIRVMVGGIKLLDLS